MMWPVLTKVQYEKLPGIFLTSRIWTHIGLSLFLNWIVGPCVMLSLAWATLPDLPNYRAGVILVGLGRCIGMVMIWNDLARGDPEYGSILIVINAVLQIILFSPLALLFLNVIGGNEQTATVAYGNVAISVFIVCEHALYMLYSIFDAFSFIVPWNTTCRWCHHALWYHLSNKQTILRTTIPTIFFSPCVDRITVHHSHFIFLSRS